VMASSKGFTKECVYSYKEIEVIKDIKTNMTDDLIDRIDTFILIFGTSDFEEILNKALKGKQVKPIKLKPKGYKIVGKIACLN